jgi:hypothetical protein
VQLELGIKMRKSKSKAPKVKPPGVSHVKDILLKLVSGMRECRNPAVWGREGRLANSLIKTYGAEFLLWLTPLEGFKVNSLMWFYSDLGKNYLSDQLVDYKQQSAPIIKEEIQLGIENIGEDIKVSFKPKTLKDFLNYGKTEEK